MTALAPSLTSFLREHLPRERNASPHTVASYAHAFSLLLRYAANRLGRSFVGSWMSSAEFDLLKSNAAFIALQKECAAAPAATNAAPEAVSPKA